MSHHSDQEIKEKNFSIFLEKCPEIAFRYMHEPFTRHKEDEIEDVELDLSFVKAEIDILFVYQGLSVCNSQELLFWLKGKKGRSLYILEDDMGQIDQFLSMPYAEQILLHPRISLHFAEDAEAMSALIEELSIYLPSDRVDLISTQKEKNKIKIEEMRLLLLRKVALIHSLCTESLHYHLLVRNLLPNFKRACGAAYVTRFKSLFKGVPAVVCGAGPSLPSVIEELKALNNRALIIAGGSAITALTNYGVHAHIHMAIDPNDEEYLRLHAAQPSQTPLLFAPRVNAKVFDTTNAPLGLMSTGTGGELEAFLEEKLLLEGPLLGRGLSQEALSVTTMAVALAEYMGCSTIILCGVDLCFTDMQRYPAGVSISSSVTKEALDKASSSLDRSIRHKDVQGRDVYTQVRWMMEAECLSLFAKEHPHIRFFRGTDRGLVIDSVASGSLKELTSLYCMQDRDIEGALHAAMQNSRIHAEELLSEATCILDHSLQKMSGIILAILEEIEASEMRASLDVELLFSARYSVFVMDLEEEIGYKVFLAALPAVLDRVLSLGLLSDEATDESKEKQKLFAKEKAKWQKILSVVQSLQKTISSADKPPVCCAAS